MRPICKYNYIIDKTSLKIFNYNEFIDLSYKSNLILDKAS